MSATQILLQTALAAAVPLQISEVSQMSDIERAEEALSCARVMRDAGEAVLFYVPGKTANSFNALARSLACLSFAPGGVSAFGMHWESQQ